MELEQLLERTRGVVREVIAPNAAATDHGRWPEAGLRALQQAGLGGLVIPRRFGGPGHSLAALVQVCELIGSECASTALCFGMHCVGSAVIAAKATDRQRSLLEEIVAGRHLTTLALSEPGTGSHFYYPETKLTARKDGTFRVDGRKTFVTNGGYADSYVVSTVAADPAAPPSQFSCVVVPNNAPGVEWGPPWDGLGLRGNSSRMLDLRQVTLPAHHLLGAEGDQLWYVFNVVAPYFLIAMSGTYLGVAAAAFEEARLHLEQRRYSHSGTRLAQSSVLQHHLGSLWGLVERTRRLIHHAADSADTGAADALPALCLAKAEVAECAVTAVNRAMTLCGGIGYRDGDRLGRLLRDARAAHVMAPTTDILLVWAGRALLNEPILGD
jgi:alkylation response protein AidB-like acyl-CoA dehydrogenase